MWLQYPGFKTSGLYHLTMQERDCHDRTFNTVDEAADHAVWRALSQRFNDHGIGEYRRCLQCVVDRNRRHIEHMFH